MTGVQTCALPDLTLTVSGSPDYGYEADIAFNLDIDASGTKVIAVISETYSGIAYDRIVYEDTLEKGSKVAVSFTAYSDADGLREVILYRDGKEVKRQDFVFTAKGS